MPLNFSAEELVDMVLLCGECRGNQNAALCLYAERFPAGRQPNNGRVIVNMLIRLRNNNLPVRCRSTEEGLSNYTLEMPRKINHLRLKLTFKRFFQMDDEEDDTADRLIIEEEQEATDPVGEISLHNTFNRGTVVDSPASYIPRFNAGGSPNKTTANNDVLGELPLSGSFDPVKDAPAKKLKRKKGEDDEQKPKKLARLRAGHKLKKNI